MLLPELWEEIYTFLDTRECSKFEQVCLQFRSICIRVEKRKLKENWLLENKYLMNPLCEAPVKEEDIKLVEERIRCHFPFHLREFLKLTDGRDAFSNNLDNLHYNNSLRPFKTWTFSGYGSSIVLGGVNDQYEPTVIFLGLDGKMWMDIHMYGTTDGIDGGWMGYLGMISCFYCDEEYNPFNMEKLSESFEDLIKLSRNYPTIVRDLPDKYKKDIEWMKKLTIRNPWILYYTPFSDDLEFVKSLILRHPRIYGHISERLKSNKDLFDLAVSKNIENFSSGHDSLKTDRELITKYFSESQFPLVSCIPKEMIDINIASHLKYFAHSVPESLQTPELLLYFLKRDGLSDIRNVIQDQAKYQTPEILKYIYEIDPAFLISLGKQDLFQFDTKEIALKLLNNVAKKYAVIAVNLLPKSLQTDIDIISAALKKSFKFYRTISNQLQQDREFIFPIWKQTRSTRIILEKEFYFRSDFEFLKVACERKSGIVFKLDRSLVTDELLNSLQFFFYGGVRVDNILKMNRRQYFQYRLQKKDNIQTLQ